jgi:hypothetical protein
MKEVSRNRNWYFMPKLSAIRRGVVFLSLFFALGVLFISLKFRPVADDFCFAQATKAGVWNAMANWYSTWVGDITVTFLNTFLVGLPGSVSTKLLFIPFIFANLLISYVVMEIFFRPSAVGTRLSMILVIFPAWCAYLWFPALTYRWINGSDGLANQIAEQSTFWQVVNSSYVVPGILFIFIFLKLKIIEIESNQKLTSRRILILVVLGICLGMSGYVLATSVFIWRLLPLAIRMAQSKEVRSRTSLKEPVYFFFSLAIGLIISFTAPGVTIRKKSLPSESFFEVASQVPKALILSFMSITQLLFSVSFLIAILTGFVLQSLFRSKNRSLDLSLVLSLLQLLCVLNIINRVSELFSYQSLAHLETSVLLVYLIGISLGAYICKSLESQFNQGLPSIVLNFLMLVWVLVVAASIVFLSHEADGFLAAWQLKSGFNSLPGFEGGWISECARGIFQF